MLAAQFLLLSALFAVAWWLELHGSSPYGALSAVSAAGSIVSLYAALCAFVALFL